MSARDQKMNPVSFALLVLMLGALFPFMAHAVEVDARLKMQIVLDEKPMRAHVALGVCDKDKSKDGTWWQSAYPNWTSYGDKCGEFGLAGSIDGTWGWNLRYANLGRVNGNAQARTIAYDDRRFINWGADIRRPECAASYQDDCLYEFHGKGSMDGFSFTVDRDLFNIGPAIFNGEAGFFLYRVSSDMRVKPLNCGSPCQWEIRVAQKSDALAFLSPTFGLMVKLPLGSWGNIFVAGRWYLRSAQHIQVTPNFSGVVQAWVVGTQVRF